MDIFPVDFYGLMAQVVMLVSIGIPILKLEVERAAKRNRGIFHYHSDQPSVAAMFGRVIGSMGLKDLQKTGDEPSSVPS